MNRQTGQDVIQQRYSKEPVLGWLSWLARGMQQHDQSIFLIEKLQPSWLSRRGQLWTYILASRVLWGVLSGLVCGLIGGLAAGFEGASTIWASAQSDLSPARGCGETASLLSLID